MPGVTVDNCKPLITQIRCSEQFAKTPILNWLPYDVADTSLLDLAIYTNDKTHHLVNNIHSLGLSSPFSAALLSFWATALYRYTYQNEFEIQYTKDNYNKDIDINDPLKLLRINFREHTQLTAEKSSQYISEILSSQNINSFSTKPPFQSDFCLIELTRQNDEALNDLKQLCALYKGKIWIIVIQTEKNYELKWLYNKRISIDIVETLQKHILNLITESLENPHLPLSNLAMLTEKEVQQQILFSEGETCKNNSSPLYKIIENYAVTQPNNVAVIYEHIELTYSQLNSQANKLANILLANKVMRGCTVAVYIAPSANILVAILAIHKVGGIYVPIDPGFPSARIEIILNEVAPSIVLCDEITDSIPSKYFPILQKIDGFKDILKSESNPDITIELDDVSHIYFTSGTTGKPKGVMATHQNLIHYVSSAINRYGFNQNDIFLSGARFTFSISMFELMVPLVSGGSVRILPREVILDLNQLSKVISTATVFHFGPSLLKQLLPYIEKNYSSFEPFSQLTHVSSGGDMVPAEILEQLKTIFYNAEIFVIYGSSEINCMGCTYEVSRDKTVTKTLVGRPHQNVKVRIFDNDLNMVPVGVAGQIYFGGKGLVKGYLNLPELTNEKFTLIDGERFYAIGDIGRFDQEGNISLLGREDFQVQIRGMRIELLEVESCLKSFPVVSDCVVIARSQQGNNEKKLIAYLVSHDDEKIIANDLTNFIASQLPDYMIPSVFVKLEKLPTNHNAKLDRSQLPNPNVKNIIVTSEFQAASNDVEKTLVNIWENLFNIKNIGIDHNFFELGGDSLLAVNFLIEIDNKFDKFIPISIMINTPTIRDIAKIVASDEPIKGVGEVVVLKKGNSEPPLFCLYGVFLYSDLANSLNTERMVCGVYLEEEVSLMHKGEDSDEFQIFSSVDNIASRYLKSIRAFQPNGPYYLCGESFGGIAALEVARKLEDEGETVKLIAMFDSSSPGYKKSLPLSKRISIHLYKILKLGWPYIKQKLSKYTKHLKLSTNIGNRAKSEIKDIRSKARNLAIKNYIPNAYKGEVTLFTAKERSEFDLGQKDLGWGKFIPNLDIHEIDGDHLEILEHGQVEKLTRILLDKIN